MEGVSMQISYNRHLTKKTRKITLELSGDDLDGLPETLRQEFLRAELIIHRPAQLVSVWARILGARPSDAQPELELEGEKVGVPEYRAWRSPSATPTADPCTGKTSRAAGCRRR